MLDTFIKEPFLGFSSESLGFLKKLENKKYNNKKWFDENRSIYEQFVKLPMRALIDNLAGELYKIDSSIVVNYKSIFRINRDVRFSKNKEPYKNMSSASFCFDMVKKPEIPQFYFHISPSEFLFAAGQYSTDPDKLKKIRKRIESDFSSFKKIIADKKLIKEFGAICGEKLTNLPRGYEYLKSDKKYELLSELIKMKQYYFFKSYKPDLAMNPEFVNIITSNIKITYDFTKFLSESIK